MHQPPSRLLYKGKGIFFQPEIIRHVGGRAASQFLQQIHYFITSSKIKGITHLERKWVYQTLDQWAEILGYSPSTIKNCIRTLQNLNIIKVDKLCKYKSNRTNFYTINYDVLGQILENKANTVENNEKELPVNGLKNHNIEKTKIIHSSAKNCLMVTTESSNKYPNNTSHKSKNSLKENIPFSELMLNAWNEIVKPDGIVTLTKKRCQYLMAVMKHVFNWDFKKWRDYCHLITTSDFLMGKIKPEFKASLDWVLKFETIQKILEGQYGIKTSLKEQQDSSFLHQEIISTIEQGTDLPVIVAAKKLFLTSYGVRSFKDWLLVADLTIEYKNSSLMIKCSTNYFVRDEVCRRFDKLLSNLKNIGINRVVIA